MLIIIINTIIVMFLERSYLVMVLRVKGRHVSFTVML